MAVEEKRHVGVTAAGFFEQLADVVEQNIKVFGMTALAFAWLLAKPEVSSVIAGATKPEQLEENVKAGDAALSAEDLAAVNALLDTLP